MTVEHQQLASNTRIRSGTLDLLMISLGLTNETIARRCRSHPATVSQWRNGRRVIRVEPEVLARAIAWEHADRFKVRWLYLVPTRALATALAELPELWDRWDHQDMVEPVS